MTDPAPRPVRRRPPHSQTGLLQAVRRLSAAQQRTAAAAVVLLVSLGLPWYSTEIAFSGEGGAPPSVSHGSMSGIGAFSFVEAAVLLVGAAVLALVWARATERRFSLPVADGTVIVAAAGWVGLLVVYRLFDTPDGGADGNSRTLISLSWGIFASLGAVGLLLATGLDQRRRDAGRPASSPAAPEGPVLDPADVVPVDRRSPPGPVAEDADATRVVAPTAPAALPGDRRDAEPAASGHGTDGSAPTSTPPGPDERPDDVRGQHGRDPHTRPRAAAHDERPGPAPDRPRDERYAAPRDARYAPDPDHRGRYDDPRDPGREPWRVPPADPRYDDRDAPPADRRRDDRYDRIPDDRHDPPADPRRDDRHGPWRDDRYGAPRYEDRYEPNRDPRYDDRHEPAPDRRYDDRGRPPRAVDRPPATDDGRRPSSGSWSYDGPSPPPVRPAPSPRRPTPPSDLPGTARPRDAADDRGTADPAGRDGDPPRDAAPPPVDPTRVAPPTPDRSRRGRRRRRDGR